MVPSQTEAWTGRPEDPVRGALDGQADTMHLMQRRPGYVIDLGIMPLGDDWEAARA